jgi:hypothetical protein
LILLDRLVFGIAIGGQGSFRLTNNDPKDIRDTSSSPNWSVTSGREHKLEVGNGFDTDSLWQSGRILNGKIQLTDVGNTTLPLTDKNSGIPTFWIALEAFFRNSTLVASDASKQTNGDEKTFHAQDCTGLV